MVDRQVVTQMLDEVAAQGLPTGADLWPVLRERALRRRRRSSVARWVPATRLGWAALALAAVVVFGGLVAAARAAVPGIVGLLQKDERLQQVDLGRAQSLDLSQTIGGVTVTLEWAYADGERVLVGYTVRSSDGRRFDPYHPALTDAGGHALPWQGGYGLTGQSDLVQEALPAGAGTYVEIFEYTRSSSALPEVLRLRFVTHVHELVLPAASPVPTASAREAGAAVVELEPLPNGETVGPFEFAFSLAVPSEG
jgi:hypothetical protein